MENMPKSHEFAVTSQVGEDTLVFDTATRKAVTLNPAAAFVYENCDGEKELDSVVASFEERFPEEKNAEEQVVNALSILQDESLVSGGSVSRRSFLKAAGVVAASIPFAASIVAPPSAAATSKECFALVGASGGDPSQPSSNTNCLNCGDTIPASYHPFNSDNTPNANAAFNCCPCASTGTVCTCTEETYCSLNMTLSVVNAAGTNPDNTLYSDYIVGEPANDTKGSWECVKVQGASSGSGICGTCAAGCGDARNAASNGITDGTLDTNNNKRILLTLLGPGVTASDVPSVTYKCCRASACC